MLHTRRGRVRCVGSLALLALATQAPAQQELERAGHVLRRTTFGPDQATLSDLLDSSVGQLNAATFEGRIEQFVDQQLDQTSSDPSPVLTGIPLLPTSLNQSGAWNIDDLARHNLALALESENQLREVLVGFWQQHFSTAWFTSKEYFAKQPGLSSADGDRLATYFEWQQNEGFRTHARGTFLELLKVSAEGVAMTIYLDNVNNVDGSPNENYARELLELHTLGTDSAGIPNGYDPVSDVEELARVFTGWTVGLDPMSGDWQFEFDSTQHDGGVKNLLYEGGSTPLISVPSASVPVGKAEGDEVLRILAESPITARFVSEKLYAFFLSQEVPDAGLISDCVTAWATAPGGNINAVLKVLLKSDAMKDAEHAWEIVERPIEALTSTYRALEGTLSTALELESLYGSMTNEMGQALFRFPSPDGYSFDSFDQLSTQQWLQRILIHQQIDILYSSATSGLDPADAAVAYDFVSLYLQYGVPLGVDTASEEDMVRWFFELLYQRPFGDLSASSEIDKAIDYLSKDLNGVPLVPTLGQLLSGPAADPVAYLQRISELVRYVTSVPRSYQK